MKYALVTGGSRGIGRAICIRLARIGYNLLINYISNFEEAQKTSDLVSEYNVKTELLKFDVSNRNDVNNVLGKWIEDNQDKRIEVLVNNAGIRKDAVLIWMQDNEWDDVISTNLNSFYNITRLVVKDMILRKYGRIINVVSLSGIKGLPGQTNYSAAKAGIIGATKALAQEVARKNITVNAVAPGFITTDMTKDMNEKDYQSLIPMKRFGRPEEVADIVGFLASEQASYITGEVISVNGGLHT